MIKLNDNLPEIALCIVVDGKTQKISTAELFKGKVALFGLPGAFTPVCSKTQLPDFAKKETELKAKGYQKIICMSVNDSFVMQAWKDQVAPDSSIVMLADGSGLFTKALDLGIDLTDHHMGIRCKRFLMVVDNSKVLQLNVEEDSSNCTISGVDSLL
ncbi:MAG: peroxiredoxin [Proteobacteria bacterium]|nr:peroxiredoxin [Pseudomonadota bacterium]